MCSTWGTSRNDLRILSIQGSHQHMGDIPGTWVLDPMKSLNTKYSQGLSRTHCEPLEVAVVYLLKQAPVQAPVVVTTTRIFVVNGCVGI